MIWAAMSSAGVGPLCFLKSTVNAAIYQETLEHFMLPSADKLYGDADLLVQQELFSSNPMCNLWDIFKRKMRNSGSNNTEELKAQ